MFTYNRQELHEAIREHSIEAGRLVKQEGKENDLISRIKADARFAAVKNELDSVLDPVNFVGRAPQQVVEFVREEIDPILEEHKQLWQNIDAKKSTNVNV